MPEKRKSVTSDPDLLSRLWNSLILSWRLMLDRRVGIGAKMIPLAVLAYIFSPIDFLPEIVLGPFGVVDDVGALLLGLQLFIRSAPPAVVDEYRNRLSRKLKRGGDDPNVIEGEYTVRDERR
jgi:uncharacterized membrane protein YkvA (DUF1232 family)